jgi:hypothetical protein
VIQASLRAVAPAALMPLRPFRLRTLRVERVHPEPLLDTWTRYVRAEIAERESITATLQSWNSISMLARE